MGNQHTVQISTLQNASAAFGSNGQVLSRNQAQLPKLQLSKLSMSSQGDYGFNRRGQVSHDLRIYSRGPSATRENQKSQLGAFSRKNSDVTDFKSRR